MGDSRLCVGVIVGAHGVRGLIKIKSFTEEPESLLDYGTVTDEGGTRRFELTLTGRAKGVLLARLAGVSDRDRAEALRGTQLYVERDALPPLDEAETFYQADLIGLEAVDRGGATLGRVKAVHNFGAGDVIEIAVEGGGATRLLPFTKAAVPEVDIAAGRLVVAPPEEVEARGPETGGGAMRRGRPRKARS